MLGAALDALAPALQAGEAQVNRRLEAVVALRLLERLLVERFRLPAPRLDLAELDQHLRTLGSGGGLHENAAKQLASAAGRAGERMEVGSEKATPTGVLPIRILRETRRLLRQLHGRDRGAACPGRACRVLQRGGDLAIRPGRCKREMPRACIR